MTQEAQNYQGEQPQCVCPNCGYCDKCGRGGYRFVPYPYYPTIPSFPTQWPYYTWAINGGMGTASVQCNSGS